MIQRIQSIYLLVAAAFSGGLIFVFAIWTLSTDKTMFALDFLKEESISLNSIPVLFLGSALLSLISIFLFKNRQTQFVVNRINILINLFLLGMLIYLSLNLPGEASVSEKGIGMFLPILVILLLVIANRAIKKDEDLVKSVDRLR